MEGEDIFIGRLQEILPEAIDEGVCHLVHGRRRRRRNHPLRSTMAAARGPSRVA